MVSSLLSSPGQGFVLSFRAKQSFSFSFPLPVTERLREEKRDSLLPNKCLSSPSCHAVPFPLLREREREGIEGWIKKRQQVMMMMKTS